MGREKIKEEVREMTFNIVALIRKAEKYPIVDLSSIFAAAATVCCSLKIPKEECLEQFSNAYDFYLNQLEIFKKNTST